MIERTMTVRLHEVTVSFNVSEAEMAEAVEQFPQWRKAVKGGKHTVAEVFAHLVESALSHGDEVGGVEIEDFRIAIDGEDIPVDEGGA